VLLGSCQRRIPGSRSRDIGYGFVDSERPGGEQSNYGLRDWPVASAYDPSTEGAGTRVCGYAIKNMWADRRAMTADTRVRGPRRVSRSE
jgi:hypothetical protein